MAGIVDSTGIYTPNEIIVDATAGRTPYQTIADAITAASTMGSPTTIYVRPGTYTEDLTLIDGINIVGENKYDTIIDGEHTIPASGQVRFKDIKLAQSTPASDVFVEAGAGTCAIDVENCIFNIDSGLSFNLPTSTGPIGIYDCLDISTDNKLIDNNTGASTVTIRNSQVGNSVALGSYFYGTTTIYNSHIGCRIQAGGTATFSAYDSVFDTHIEAADTVTVYFTRCTLCASSGEISSTAPTLNFYNSRLLGRLNLSGSGEAYVWSSTISDTTGNAATGTSKIYCYDCDVSTPAAVSFTLADTAELHAYNSTLHSTSAATVDIGATANAYICNTVIDSTVGTGEPAIGTGTLYYENTTFSNTATNIVATVTQEPLGLIRANNIQMPQANATGTEGVIKLGTSSALATDANLFTVNESIYLGRGNFSSGNNCVGIGFKALDANTSGQYTVSIGNYSALFSEPTNQCVCIGHEAGAYLASPAIGCTLIGTRAGGGSDFRGVYVGSYNTAVGYETLRDEEGTYSTAVGSGSLINNNPGAVSGYNTALGANIATLMQTGAYNLLLGYNTGDNYNGSESSNIILMNTGTAGEDNVIRIGTQGTGNGQQDTCYIAGIAGSSVSNQQAVVIDSTTGQLGVNATLPVGSIEVTADGTLTNNATSWNNKPAALLSIALPATAAIGTTLRLVGYAANGWTITQGAGQQVHFDAATSTTAGIGGTISSNDRYDCIELLCVVADTEWVVVNVKGNPTVV
jgi:hypothetical protein